jgi:hypothetical protein
MSFVSTDKKHRTVLKIIVQPKAKRTLLLGLHDDMVKLGVTAPPVDGKANLEVITYLAGFFGLKKKDITIISGEHSRKKICIVGRLDEEETRRRILSFLQ